MNRYKKKTANAVSVHRNRTYMRRKYEREKAEREAKEKGLCGAVGSELSQR